LTSAARYADYDGYIGPIDFDTYMDRRRWGRNFLLSNNDDNTNNYHTASVITPCSRYQSNYYQQPEDMKREYRLLPSSRTTAELADESVAAAMDRLRNRNVIPHSAKVEIVRNKTTTATPRRPERPGPFLRDHNTLPITQTARGPVRTVYNYYDNKS
jgi:hypothetical protein